MSKILFALVLCSLIYSPLATFPSQAEEEVTPGLECTYTGTWSMKGAKGNFSWHGFWFQGDGGWIFRGNGKGDHGKSQLKGACGNGECEFGQNYVSGKYKGKGYSYQSKYPGDLGDVGPLKLALSGPWSNGNSYTADDKWAFKGIGQWKATPSCKAVANIGDLTKVLGWAVW
jgi:hypothetical protein